MTQAFTSDSPQLTPPPAGGHTVRISLEAAEKLRELMNEQEGRQMYLRIGVQGGGCSGLKYTMYFDDELRDGDAIVEQHGIQVAVDPKSLTFIDGSELHFTSGLDGQGFHFQNPKATRSCGCGSSFSV